MCDIEADKKIIPIIEGLQIQLMHIEALKAATDHALNKRALAVAATELETSMLWLANARPD